MTRRHDDMPFLISTSVQAVERAVEDAAKEKMNDPTDDPLLVHLQSKYKQQRNRQIAEKKRKVENDHAESMGKNIHELLHPSLELLSDFAILLMNELETLCMKNHLNRGVELVKEIRAVTNNELRQAVSAIEGGYTSGFQALQRQAGYKYDVLAPVSPARGVSWGIPSTTPPHAVAPDASSGGRGGGDHQSTSKRRGSESALVTTSNTARPASSKSGEPYEDTASKTNQKEVLTCPKDWKENIKKMVLEELHYQNIITRPPRRPGRSHKEKQFSLKESCSAIPALFAESLAFLLVCEVVRIYLYDANRNLHCCSTYPYHAFQGDPMHGTYTEIMLAKDFHAMVCSQVLAVNGSESPKHSLSKQELQQISEDLQNSGWGSIRSCLMFPIVPLTRPNHNALGIIHCVNKVAVSDKDVGKFTSDDEVLCAMASRVLGGILSRYPVANFSLRVGELLRKATYPFQPTTAVDDHFPDRWTDPVVDAAEAGYRAVVTPVPIKILRAPLSDIDPSKRSRSRMQKVGSLTIHDSALSSMEFNIRSVNDLWQTGMEENVIMHQEYRKLEESMRRTKLLLQNVLDGLASARTMRSTDEINAFLRTLELFGRSESVEMLSEFVSETLTGKIDRRATKTMLFPEIQSSSFATFLQNNNEHIARGKSPGYSESSSTPKPWPSGFPPKDGTFFDASSSKTLSQPENSVETKKKNEEKGNTAYLTADEAKELLHRHQLLNAIVPARIHADGPDCIRCYSCDPAKKREQMIYIDQMMEEGTRRNKALTEAGLAWKKVNAARQRRAKALNARKGNRSSPQDLLQAASATRERTVGFDTTPKNKEAHPFFLDIKK